MLILLVLLHDQTPISLLLLGLNLLLPINLTHLKLPFLYLPLLLLVLRVENDSAHIALHQIVIICQYSLNQRLFIDSLRQSAFMQVLEPRVFDETLLPREKAFGSAR